VLPLGANMVESLLSVEPIEIRAAAGRKQAIYFGAPGRPLFGFYHPPKDGLWRGVGVVLCNPIGTDQTRSDRAYRHLAERLAAAGFACLRFDLYGTGDSGGDEFSEAPGGGIVSGWVSDVGVAATELRSRSGSTRIALVGLRLGATLALLHASDPSDAEKGGIDSLVLWNPCVSGAGFVTEVTKLHKVYARIEPQMAGAPSSSLDGEEALGCFLPRALIEELSQVDLAQTGHRPARRTLVLTAGTLPGQEPLLARLRDLGAAPEVRSYPGHKFLITVSHRSLVPDEPIDAIVAWLAEAHPLAAAPHTATETSRFSSAVPPPFGERALLFGSSRSLFGILTPAAPGPARADRPSRPSIILTNAGCVNRVGPHRIYVKMARRWAELGFDVLRVDLSGIGDSPAVPGEKENLTYPASGLDDLAAAMKAVGGGPVILAGLCSGGDYAFQLGARSTSVVAAWLLNPRTFCVLDLAAVESGVPPTSPVDEVPRTLRSMSERGVDTLLVVSRNDPGVAYVDLHAGDGMRALVGVPAFQRIDLDGADHSFTPVVVQESVARLLTEHLAARY
jgi:alpha-beta hydrolase superfamily lysophospholipase